MCEQRSRKPWPTTPSCSLLDRAQRTDRVRSTFRDVDLIWELRRIDSAEGWPCPIRGLNQGGIDNGENAVAEGGRGNQRVISPPLIQPPPEAIRTPDRENVCPAHSSVSEWSIGIHTSDHPSFPPFLPLALFPSNPLPRSNTKSGFFD